jgi:hypothetical protein
MIKDEPRQSSADFGRQQAGKVVSSLSPAAADGAANNFSGGK